MAKPYKSIRMFKNPWMEKISHVHPLTPLIFWTPFFIYFMRQSLLLSDQLGFINIAFLGVAGFLAWTLMEYVLHRFLFHYVGESPTSERVHFLIHGFHHDDASDPTRLVMTPVVSATLGLVFYLSFSSILGPVWVQPFFAFFIVGYLCYDYIHYYVHFANPKHPVGRYLKQYHMKHHYAGSESRWGVSSPLWDYVFGTAEEVFEAEAKSRKA